MIDYFNIDIINESDIEKKIIDLCVDNLGKNQPFVRRIGSLFIDFILSEIRNGDVYVAIGEDNELVGVCVFSPPSCDKRIEEYFSEYICSKHLAVLIVNKGYRGQGYAMKLLKLALNNRKEKIILITPKNNIPAISLYEKLGMKIVVEFDQSEIDYNTGADFNLRRVVMVGDVKV